MTEAKPPTLTPLVRYLLIPICCLSGAASVLMPGSTAAGSPVPYVCGTLLAAVYGVAFYRGTQGRFAASWAVMAFGSWMVFLVTMFAHVLYAGRDNLQADGWFLAILAGILAIITYRGLRAAWRGDWDKCGAWWMATLVMLLVLTPQHLYAERFAIERAKSRANAGIAAPHAEQ